MPSLDPSAQKVQDALDALGFGCRVVELPGSTRTAQEAAQAVGASLGQIVKSLVFRGANSGRPLLVETSGANRASEARLAALAGEPVQRAAPDFVRQATGFAIGGVPPIAHSPALENLPPALILIDEDFFQYAEIWAAAGTPRAVFRLTPAQLVQMTGGQVACIKE